MIISDKYKSSNGYAVICECDYCGIYKKRSYAGAIKQKTHFCGREHYIKFHRLDYFCYECGKKILRYIKPGEIKKYEHHFCDKKCKGIWWSKNFCGVNHPLYKGGIYKHHGYVCILKHDHPYCNSYGYVNRSRLVMEKFLDRLLEPNEEVHHINGIKDDDSIENLRVMIKREHSRLHGKKRFGVYLENQKLKEEIEKLERINKIFYEAIKTEYIELELRKNNKREFLI